MLLFTRKCPPPVYVPSSSRRSKLAEFCRVEHRNGYSFSSLQDNEVSLGETFLILETVVKIDVCSLGKLWDKRYRGRQSLSTHSGSSLRCWYLQVGPCASWSCHSLVA